MCIAYLAIGAHPDWPLFIAANRDEFHARPTTAAGPWPAHPDLLAGIDDMAGGTWLGVTRKGRFGLLTNYRDMAYEAQAASRGALVAEYLKGETPPGEYAAQVARQGGRYNGFNLIVGDLEQTCYAGNRHGGGQAVWLEPGRYVLSNHLLNTAWPKTQRLKTRLDEYPLEELAKTLNPVFDILKDTTPAEDDALPRTGLSLERERLLSSPFIISPEYGTRCSTAIAIRSDGRGFFSEVTYDPQGMAVERHDWPFIVTERPALAHGS